MKRILATVIAGLMGAVLLSTDASAWNRKRHYRRHSSRVYVRVVPRPFFRPYYYRAPRIVYYPAPVYHETYVYPSPVYRETYVSPAPANPGQVLGAILGGIGGGVIGHQIGGGSGKAIATVAGSLIGVLVGGEIGRQLDQRDRLLMASTTNRTLETTPSGTSIPWRNPDSGAYGTVTPQPAYQNAQGEYCREYTQKVIIGGKEDSAYGTACRNPDGTWRLAPTR